MLGVVLPLTLAKGQPAGLVGSIGVDTSTTGRVAGPRTTGSGVDPNTTAAFGPKNDFRNAVLKTF